MDYATEFSKLLPNELYEIKEILNVIIEEITNIRVTNLKYQEKNQKITCPICNENNIVKNGFKNQTQRYKCKNCNKFFSISTNKLTNKLRLNYNQLINFMQCLVDCKTLTETSKIVSLSLRETYNIRIKIISVLSNYHQEKLHDVVECDEKYITLSFKGTRKDKMPRESRRNGFESKSAGMSKEQVCVLMAIDSYDNIYAKIVGLGQLTTKELNDNLADKIEKNSIIVTDSKSAYIKFAKENNFILKQIQSGKYKTDDGYHLGELNSLMSELDMLLKKYRGLSTRHLQEYLDFFRVRKILKYCIEYLQQSQEIYNYSLLQPSVLKAREICKKEMPINVNEIYNTNFK